MKFDVLNKLCVSTQFHPVLVVAVPWWRVLVVENYNPEKINVAPFFLYNIFVCRTGFEAH